MESKDQSFYSLSFDGKPASYREFRRKTILAVASLESKHVHLAGPRLLARLTGEAYRATEHLNVSELRQEDGWTKVIRALDAHYQFLPETEMHDAVDSFLFDLKRRPHEGATSFASRFKTALARVQTLIAQERETLKVKRRRQGKGPKDAVHDPPSSVEPTDEETYDEDIHGRFFESLHRQPPAGPAASAAGARPASAPGEHEREEPPPPADAEVHTEPARSRPASTTSSKRKAESKGTQAADEEKDRLKMEQMLGNIEKGHLKPKPIFPQTVLGHLFMKKFGLSREQKAQVIRATGGSARFQDVEKILRASDMEESRSNPENRRFDTRRPHPPPRRRDTFVAQAAVPEGDSLGLEDIEELALCSESGSEEALVADGDGDEQAVDSELEAELQEVYEVKQKAKKDFKKSFKTYKETRKKVRELKRARQPYFPVVAIQPESGGPPSGTGTSTSSQMPAKQSFRYDKSGQNSRGGPKAFPRKKPEVRPRREDANFAEAGYVTEFNYMINEGQPLEILLASIPLGCVIIDTGCTTSVVGRETAQELTAMMKQYGFPLPVDVELPPVELRGFSGEKTTTTSGLKWTVKLGSLWGTVTTYVIEGRTPFLLSRRVLEGMQATLDLGAGTISSEKHHMSAVPLKRAANGHLLLPICEFPSEYQAEEAAFAGTTVPSEEAAVAGTPAPSKPSLTAMSQVINEPNAPCAPSARHSEEPKQKKQFKTSSRDRILSRKKALQHMKNTRQGIVNMSRFHEELKIVFGDRAHECKQCFVAYRPRLERIPEDAMHQPYLRAVATLSTEGILEISPWIHRAPGRERQRVGQTNVAVYAFIPVEQPPPPEPHPEQDHPACLCCSEHCVEGEINMVKDYNPNLQTVYEETDWVDVGQKPINKPTTHKLLGQIGSLRQVNAKLILSRMSQEKHVIKEELRDWLKDQAWKLDADVSMIEVFTGKAPLSKHVHQATNKPCITLGWDYGQDFDRLTDRKMLLYLLATVRAPHVWFSFPCGCWGPWSRFNMAKGPEQRDRILQKRQTAKRHLRAVSEAWHLQQLLGGHCHAENPYTSEAWGQLSLGRVHDVRIDMCSLGMRCPKTNLPVLKPTRVITTMDEMAECLVKCRCDHKHTHAHLEGNYKGRNLSSWCETYPSKFCRTVASVLSAWQPVRPPIEDVFAAEDADSDVEMQPIGDVAPDLGSPVVVPARQRPARIKAIVNKLHINTGHASPEQMLRLAKRCQSSQELQRAIRDFKCPVCEELKVPVTRRQATMPHAEKPNEIVGVDYVQVELKREDSNGQVIEDKYNVLTCVCLATGFAQQIIVEKGYKLRSAFHDVWGRPYGVPKVVYMDPTWSNISKEFQEYLAQNNIQLLLAAAESHWQLGLVEVTNKVLRNMAQKVWKTTRRPAREVIETCSSVRNEQLRRCGFSPAQWFLGQDSRHVGMLMDLDEQQNIAVASQIIEDPDFYAKVRLREAACEAFHKEHAKDIWRRALAGRNRPMRGPYCAGQLVYIFRRTARGLLSTRHGVWLGPGRVIGTESSKNSPIPRIVWVSFNGYLYRCSPEGLRPVPEDEAEFRRLARSF